MEAERQQIERILQSKAFRGSEVQRSLLAYLGQKSLTGEADSLKEYTVGLDALGKPESYDPRHDSVVRVHVARLRTKLGEYYRTEGATDRIRVDLPKGAFKVVFETLPAPEQPLATPVAAPSRRREFGWIAALVVVAGIAIYLGIRLWRTERITAAAPAWTPEIQQLWDPILGSDRPLVVCIAARLMVRVPGVGFVRDPSLDE